MLALRVQILGTTAARPFRNRFTSSAYVSRGGSSILLDCGEGILTQVPPKALGQRGLDAVCITHLHGDHVYGLPGLLSSMTLGGRTRALDLLGPPALRDYVGSVFAFTESSCSFELRFPVLPKGASSDSMLSLRDLVIHSLPLRHRISAYGFCVSSPVQLRRMRPGVVEEYGIPYATIGGLKQGADLTLPDRTLSSAELTLDPHPRQSFAYLTDTAPLDAWPTGWPLPDLLLHDATFGSADLDLADISGHSTTMQATAFAKTIGAGTLLLSHISVRYSEEERDQMIEEATEYLRSARVRSDTTVRWATQGEIIEL